MCVKWFAAVVSVARCVCSSGGLAAEEPGQRSERGSMRSHPHAEEKAPEHPELHTSSAQERPLETTGPAGKRQQHMDALNCSIRTSCSPHADLKSADSVTAFTAFEFLTKKREIVGLVLYMYICALFVLAVKDLR